MILTMKDKLRANVITAIMDGKLDVKEAGRILGRSVRQIFRMQRRMREQGIEGLVHKNRGKQSPFKLGESIKEKVITLAKSKYRDVNDTHMKELLFKEEGIAIGREVLRKTLRGAGILPKRSIRKPKYRRRRERKDALGIMLQVDASPHDWLEGRGPWIVLVGAKDDATAFRFDA